MGYCAVMPVTGPHAPPESFRRKIPWWGWVFIVFVRVWTVVMTLASVAVVIVAVMLFLWVGKHPGRTDLKPFFVTLAARMGAVADTLGSDRSPKR